MAVLHRALSLGEHESSRDNAGTWRCGIAPAPHCAVGVKDAARAPMAMQDATHCWDRSSPVDFNMGDFKG